MLLQKNASRTKSMCILTTMSRKQNGAVLITMETHGLETLTSTSQIGNGAWPTWLVM